MFGSPFPCGNPTQKIRVPNKGRWAHIDVKLLHCMTPPKTLRFVFSTTQFCPVLSCIILKLLLSALNAASLLNHISLVNAARCRHCHEDLQGSRRGRRRFTAAEGGRQTIWRQEFNASFLTDKEWKRSANALHCSIFTALRDTGTSCTTLKQTLRSLSLSCQRKAWLSPAQPSPPLV